MNDYANSASDYVVFGLRVRSGLPLPELFPAASQGAEPDVLIEESGIEAPEAEPGLSQVDGGLLLTIPDVARFFIAGGRSIRVDAENGVDPRNVRLFLLGSAFGALLHQRGLLPLHANAIEIDGSVVAFMGHSGAGKSTLAAWFLDRGHRLVADDVCVVGYDADGVPHAAPGLPRLRLWAEALETMGKDPEGLARSYVSDQYEKYDVPVRSASAAMSQCPLTAIYLLDRGDQFEVRRLNGVEAAEAVFANTYRGGFLSMTGGQTGHWQSAVALVRNTPVFRVARQWDLGKLDEQCGRILKHVQQMLERVEQ